MSVTEHDSWSMPEPPIEDWGDGPAPYAPGERPTSPNDRTPPQDMAAEQSVLGSMLLSKDAIADVAEVLRGVDFYRPAHETIHAHLPLDQVPPRVGERVSVSFDAVTLIP